MTAAPEWLVEELCWADWWDEQRLALSRRGTAAVLASGQGFVLTPAQARACGYDRARVRGLVRRGEWTPVARGALAPWRLPGPESRDPEARFDLQRRRHALRASAATLVRPQQVISGASAAVVHGLPVLSVPDGPELTARRSITAGNRSAVRVRSAALRPAEVTDWFGAPVTTPARTLVDIARHDRRAAIVAADAAYAQGLVTAPDVRLAARRAAGWPGVAGARAVLALASPLSESPLESLTRLAIHEGGLPMPELQVVIDDPVAGRSYRVDMLWRDRRVVLEADGRLKYTGSALWREKLRQEALERLGYRVVRVVWRDIVRDWPATEDRIRVALAC